VWYRLDFVIHAVAFSDRTQLTGRYVETTADNFQMTMNISVYSLTAIAQRAEKMMTDGGSIVTLTYYGSEKVMPHYNVMGVAKAALEACVRYLAVDLGPQGVRVNAISAGPIRTLAAAGIAGFKSLHGAFREVAPLRRNVTIEDVGGAAVYLSSDLAAGITGEVHYVDAGFNVLGVPLPDEA
ncbi:MAG: enoyl-ACP reductase FabI, partial [Candidatus Limnocylindrales bacterium]